MKYRYIAIIYFHLNFYCITSANSGIFEFLLFLFLLGFMLVLSFLFTEILIIIMFLSSLVGEINIFPYKRAQRCADTVRTFKAGKEAGGAIKLLPNLPLVIYLAFSTKHECY